MRPGDRRYTETIHTLNLVDLTCAICLDGFVLRPDQDPDHKDGKLVNLPCSIHHTFHPDCIKEWL